MKSSHRIVLLVLVMSAAACGGDVASVSAEALSAPCPEGLTAPSPISSLPRDFAFYPLSTDAFSTHTVVTAPNDADAFHASGFDVRAQCLMFHVFGSRSRGELDLLRARWGAPFSLSLASDTVPRRAVSA